MLKYNQCTKEELSYAYVVDKYICEHSTIIYRAISINAPVERIFPWLTQLRYAPYSYDWIDNLGRQSPQHIISDAPPLKIGDTIMLLFNVPEFKENEFLSFALSDKAPGFIKILLKPFPFYAIYQLFRQPDNCCRLVVKIIINSRPATLNRIFIKIADFLDYIMIRKQLLNFKRLAENSC